MLFRILHKRNGINETKISNWTNDYAGIEKRRFAKQKNVKKEISLKIAAVDKKSDTVLFYQPTLSISTDDAKDIYEFSHDKSQPNQYSNAIAYGE
ncbi:hypothetical protein KOY48_01440 [Candidatus Minimicrobia naudis]|uniref:Uncharacterized protein n=1 Tax=Candidatus Minimicrobia naudis TaxID=2841263 RepID=A0A8F1MCQ8_9BACT|nr:hypothetical protein KOY48_01440 [Candidatus Minimicrobia naudis]